MSLEIYGQRRIKTQAEQNNNEIIDDSPAYPAPLCQLTLTEAPSLPIRGASNTLQPADDCALSSPFPHCVQSTDSIYRPLKMIQTFIALLSEHNTTKMKYRRNEADIFCLKVLLASNVTAGTHREAGLSLFQFLSLFLLELFKYTLLFQKGNGQPDF